MEEKKLNSDIISLLEEACKKSINNFDVVIHDDNTAGLGCLGELIFITLKNKTNPEELHFAVKQTVPAKTTSNVEIMNSTFFNEIHFYKTIWPAFEKFQESFPDVKLFDKIPKYFASSSIPGREKLVLENLKFSDFEMIPRDGTFNDSHTRFLMEIYGQFHGISAAFREHKPLEYKQLAAELKETRILFLNTDMIRNYLSVCMREVAEWSTNDDIKEKLQRYVDEGAEIAIKSLKYNGKNPVFNHGDCWSNNLMFKIRNGGFVDIRLLDFQLCRSGSVVNDLSYLIYAGATKDIIENLDYYLQIYYDSFSNTMKTFGLDPINVFTFNDLKKEWKEHYAMGFVVSQMLWRSKFSKSFEKRTFVEMTEGDNTINVEMYRQEEAKCEMDKENIAKICSDLVEHLHNNGYL